NIGLTVDPPAKANEVSKLHIGWIKPGFNKIQEHIDYRITVIKDGQNTFGPIPLTHTSIGTVKIPVEFTSNGEHQIKVEMEGILFQPIPLETTYFTIEVGEAVIF
ncbi:copper-binding protein, partial [Candidatus Nitrosopelagicus sp.]|nr:copper-binding protein [Candidatus Nitrosopelagicus sp.]